MDPESHFFCLQLKGPLARLQRAQAPAVPALWQPQLHRRRLVAGETESVPTFCGTQSHPAPDLWQETEVQRWLQSWQQDAAVPMPLARAWYARGFVIVQQQPLELSRGIYENYAGRDSRSDVRNQ